MHIYDLGFVWAHVFTNISAYYCQNTHKKQESQPSYLYSDITKHISVELLGTMCTWHINMHSISFICIPGISHLWSCMYIVLHTMWCVYKDMYTHTLHWVRVHVFYVCVLTDSTVFFCSALVPSTGGSRSGVERYRAGGHMWVVAFRSLSPWDQRVFPLSARACVCMCVSAAGSTTDTP